MATAIDRRQFMLFLGPSALALTCRSASPATSTSNIDELRVPILSEVSTRKLTMLPTHEVSKAYRGLAYVLYNSHTGDATAIAREAKTAAEQGLRINGSQLINGLTNYFGRSEAAAIGLGSYNDDVYAQGVAHGFDGLIHAGSARAYQMASIIARGSMTRNEITDLLVKLPLPSDLDQTTRSVLTDLFNESSGSLLGRIARTADFAAISRVNRKLSSDTLVNDLSFDARLMIRQLADTIRNTPAQKRKALQSALESGFATALSTAHDRGIRDFEAAAADMNAIGAIGQFVLGNIMNNKKAAAVFSQGISVAQTALNIGFIVSRGGLGTFAGVSGIMGGLSSLQGIAGNGNADADIAQSMIRQLGQQIEQLREEMIAHFERVEQLEKQALSLLWDIRIELRAAEVSVKAKIDELRREEKSLNDKLTIYKLDDLVGEFEHLRLLAKKMIAGSRSRYTDKEKVDVLSSLLEYAATKKGAGHRAYISFEGEDIRSAVKNAGRIDLLVGLLGAAAQILNLPNISKLSLNPIEWARGVQAYLEANAALGMNDAAVKQQAHECWEVGRDMYELINRCRDNGLINHASKVYSEAISKIAVQLHGECRDLTGWTSPLVGAPRETQIVVSELGWQQMMGDPGPWVGKSLYMVDYSGRLFSRGPTKDDLFWYAFDHGRIDLVYRSGTPVDTAPGVGEYEVVGREIKKQRKPLATIKIGGLWFEGGQRVRIVDTLGLSLNQLLTAVREQMTDEAEVKEWINAIPEARNNDPYQNFEKVAAAHLVFMTIVNWCITDRPDNPWNSGFASQIIRSLDDVKFILSKLLDGASREYLPLFEGTAYYAKLDKGLPRDGAFRSYDDMGMWPEFDVIVRNILDRYGRLATKAANEVVEWNSQRPPRSSIGLIDRTLGKLGAHLSL